LSANGQIDRMTKILVQSEDVYDDQWVDDRSLAGLEEVDRSMAMIILSDILTAQIDRKSYKC
jgi:hypothetical protein